MYALGECDYQYHGANRLGANSLLSCIFDGLFGGPCIKNYATDVAPTASADVPQGVYDAVVKSETDKQNWLVNNAGNENPYLLWQEMGKAMTDNCTVVRYNDRLERTLEQCQDWKARYRNVRLSDTGMWTNQNLSFARALRDMILSAEAILKGALMRNESRGAHFKPDFAERDDVQFLRTTLVTYDAASDSAQISYGPVDVSLSTPRARTYGKKDAGPKSTTGAGANGSPSSSAPAAAVPANV
jgi:succinate dehydrogenase / fumarate reductase, flavoprotein subunit